MELFLTSSVHAVAHDIVTRVDFLSNKKLVFITTAAEPKEEGDDLEWLRNDRQALVDAGFSVEDYTITGKTLHQMKNDLSQFKFVYLSGGDTAYLLAQSQKTGFIDLVKDFVYTQDKIYIGTSAGSIIAGPVLADYFDENQADLKDRQCYGFVNFTILPHWGSEHFKDRYLGGRIESVFRDDQVPLLLLTDHHYVHIKNGQTDIIEVSN